MIHHRKSVLVACAALLAAACATPPVETAAVKPDRRQGEEVSRICVGSKATRLYRLDSNSMLLTVAEKDTYKLELDGCKVRKSASSIDLTSNLANDCLEASVVKAADTCVVRKIYKWDSDVGGPYLSAAYNSPRSY